MSENIYNLFREYNRLLTKPQKSKYLTALDYNTRKTFQNLLNYSDNAERFENIYDGWIDNINDEVVILEVYSVILSTRQRLEKFCVDDKDHSEFIQNKKSMLLLLLTNKQYTHASKLLDVHMFSENFKKEKLKELREEVLKYLTVKRMVLPKKLILEIYSWADEHKLPSYLATDIEGDFKFNITNDVLPIKELKKAITKELKSTKIEKIVDCLVDKNRVS